MNETVAPVSSIAEGVNRLADMEGLKAVSTQSVGQAIKRLTEKERKYILTSKDPSFYGFTNPLMRGYIRLTREQK